MNGVKQHREEAGPREDPAETIPVSPEVDEPAKALLETSFDYTVEVEYKKESNDDEKQTLDDSVFYKTSPVADLRTTADTNNDVSNQVAEEQAEGGECEVSKKDLGLEERQQKYSSSLSHEINGEGSVSLKRDAVSPDVPGHENGAASVTKDSDDELEYSQQLRKSSKKLSNTLRLEDNIKGYKGSEIGAETVLDNTGHREADERYRDDVTQQELKDFNDTENTTSTEVFALDSEDAPMAVKLTGGRSGTVGEGHEGRVSQRDHNQSEGNFREMRANDDLAKVTEMTSRDVVTSPEVHGLRERIGELEKVNSVLKEESRELKKSSRTFEGKCHVKEREVEDLEGEKNDLTVQIQEISTDLHSVRAENTKLHTSLDEANAKLNDVDGWVTRDVFEDIRGQLSESWEKIEEKEDEVSKLKKELGSVKEENKRIEVLESEVEGLREEIKGDKDEIKGINKDLEDKVTQIRDLKSENRKFRSLLEDRVKEKCEIEKRLEELQKQLSNEEEQRAEETKDFQNKLSDREYELLILKEEKKEVSAKFKAVENVVESLKEDLKKKDGEHEEVISEMRKQNEIKDEVMRLGEEVDSKIVDGGDCW